jgi:uncharacterized protein (TIRG00374 family)
MTETARDPGTRKRPVFVAVGLLSSAAFMLLAIRRVHTSEVERTLAAARLVPWVPLAVASYLAGHVVRGVRCKLLVSRDAKLSAATATNVVVLGYAVNNILPARLGELARAGMLAQRSGMPFLQSLTVTFLERLLDGLVLLLLLVVASSLVPDVGWIDTTLDLGVAVFGVATFGVLLAVLAPTFLLSVSSRLSHPLGPRVHARVVSLVGQASAGVAYLRRPDDAARVLALSVVVWLLEAGMFLALLPAFGVRAAIGTALLAMTITNLGILVPSSPGFIGAFHFFCMKALVAVGVAEAVAFGYAALVHLSFYVPITAWGLVVLLGYGVSVGETVARARGAEPLALTDALLAEADAPRRPSPPARVDPFVRALVEALVPIDECPEPARAKVIDDAAAFVRGELDALAGRLAVLFGIGMLGFRIVTVLRFARGFTRLPLATRRAWAERWAYGGLSLARQLFKAVRSTAVVAFYEHPAVDGRTRSGVVPLRVAS